MKHLLLSILIFGFGISGSLGQTIKTLGYNTTNGQVVANTGTNVLTFTNNVTIKDVIISNGGIGAYGNRVDLEQGIIDGSWEFNNPVGFGTTSQAATTRANLGFSTNLNTLWTATNASNARSAVGLGATWLTNTNVTNYRTAIGLGWSALTNTNAATRLIGLIPSTNISGTAFSNVVVAQGGAFPLTITNRGIDIVNVQNPYITIGNTIGTDWLTNDTTSYLTTVTGDYITVGEANAFLGVAAGSELLSSGRLFLKTITNFLATNAVTNTAELSPDGLAFSKPSAASTTRTNLGLGFPALTNTNASSFREAIDLGATNTVTFGGIVNNGNFTNNNGTIYGLKTNVGPFEGIGNFFASNNTTVGNETLFRVGVAETTNKSAQFGFRIARTNNGGEGLAVFSVFGYNALMMIGPSDRSRSNSLTNTNAAIEADIWTMHETNRVMTLRDTNTGATVMHRPIGFNTNEVSTTAPSNTTVTNPTGWIQIYVGTNSVRVPYYQ